jgi:hypothetical protein
MSSASGRNATRGRCSGPARLAHPVRPDLPLKPSPSGRKRVHRNVFVYVHRLRMLSQVVEARETPRAVALERAFASVFPNMVSFLAVAAAAGMAGVPDVTGQVLAPCKAEVAWRVLGAIEPL